MPFTPFHLGPVSWLGLLFLRFINIGAFLVASIIPDIEPFCVLVFDFNYPLHGFFHSFFGGTVVVGFLSLFLYRFRFVMNRVFGVLKLSQNSSFHVILLSCFLGIYLHILLDSFLYADIKPFFPFDPNPFYGRVSSSLVYLFCTASFILGCLFYVTKLARRKWKLFLKIISIMMFVGFVIVTGCFLTLQWLTSPFDDGPFRGFIYKYKVEGIPDSSIKLDSKYIVDVYNRENEHPILVVRDYKKNIFIQANVIAVNNIKKYENCKIAELNLLRSKSTSNGYHVQGKVYWTYGREIANFYLSKNGELKKFYLGW